MADLLDTNMRHTSQQSLFGPSVEQDEYRIGFCYPDFRFVKPKNGLSDVSTTI